MLSHAMKLMISDDILPKESSTILTIQYIVNGYDFQLPLDSGKMGENSNCGKLLCEHEREKQTEGREKQWTNHVMPDTNTLVEHA